ncbi:uncharacterized protein LOC141712390 isoform X2 [Apium graveolens]|uniref:uncharacterized protein LOC141712390 isoform X2 n=1 Tax=Apium graveolens TaxID=4045 RepID=UPI003D7A1F07
MFTAVKLQSSYLPPLKCNRHYQLAGNFNSRRPMNLLRLPHRRFTSHSVHLSNNDTSSSSSEPLESSAQYTSTVAAPPPPIQLNLTQRHILLLNFIACAMAVSATWFFLCAIPTLLAFKRAAESMEKLLDVTREELPDTMAAVRLSGMEISDLTMELSDLGQEINQGVKSSTRAVRLAEEKLRGLANISRPGGNNGTNKGSRTSVS